MQLVANTTVFLVFFMIPFLGGNHLPLYFITVDRFWIEGGFGVTLVLATLFNYLANKTSIKGFLRFVFFLAPFMAISFLSLLYSWNKFNTIQGICVLGWAVGVVYLFYVANNRGVCLIGLVAGATACSAAAVLQHVLLFPNLSATFQHGLYAQFLREQFGLPFASYAYHNMLGGYLAFVLPLALYYATVRNSTTSVLAAALIIIGAVLTASRIGIGIMLFSLLATSGICLWRERKSVLIRLLVIVLLATGVSWYLIYGGGTTKNIGVQRVVAEKVKTASSHISTINTRTEIWRNSVNAFRNQPALGFGLGAFEYGYRKYFDGNSYTSVAHSIIIKTLVELGIIGLICFGVYMVAIAVNAPRVWVQSLGPFILLAVVSGTVFGLIDFSFDITSHVLTFFLLSSALIIADGSEAEKKARPLPSYRNALVFTMIVALSAGALFFNVRMNLGRNSIEAGDAFFENGFTMNALGSYREAIKVMPLNYEGAIKAITALLAMYTDDHNKSQRRAIEDELRDYVRVLTGFRDKNSEAFLITGKACLVLGEREKAEENFAKALHYYPTSAYYIFEVASYYASEKRFDEAMAFISAFEPQVEKYVGPYNPRGIFVYRIRDLKARILFEQGFMDEALSTARQNYEEAKENKYVITSIRSRNYTMRDELLKYLWEKVKYYEAAWQNHI